MLFDRSTLKPKVSSSSALPTLVKKVSWCSGFAVDWETDRIYWANCESESVDIMYCNLSSCNEPVKVLSHPHPGDPDHSFNVINMIIDPYEKLVINFNTKC